MAEFKIGVTEAGDAGLDLSWVGRLCDVDGAIVITKQVSSDFCNAVMENKDKLIVHATITGFGHSVLEPNVPSLYEEQQAVMELVNGGFSWNKVVIRIDPIIPTDKGLHTAFGVFKTFMGMGFNRYRISVIDMYPHVRERFLETGLPLPYGSGFSPSKTQLAAVDNMLRAVKEYWAQCDNNGSELRIESCAEPGLHETIQCGCVSAYDTDLLGLRVKNDIMDSVGYQRSGCMCYSGKTELLKHKNRCQHGCLYCYWKSIKD